ncbi:MAG: hypothetical protein ACYCX3_08580 [Thermoleophilia bacterium]
MTGQPLAERRAFDRITSLRTLAVLVLLAVALAAAGCHAGTVAQTMPASSTGLRETVTTAAGSATDGAAGSAAPSILFPQADMQTPILLFPYGKDLFLATTPNGDTIYCLDAEARVRWSTRVERQQRFDLSAAYNVPRALLLTAGEPGDWAVAPVPYRLLMLEEVAGAPRAATLLREFEEHSSKGLKGIRVSADGTRVLLIWTPRRSPTPQEGDIDHGSIEVMDDSGHTVWQRELPANQSVYTWAADDRLATVAVSYAPFSGEAPETASGRVEIFHDSSLLETIDVPGLGLIDLSPDGTSLLVSMLEGSIPGGAGRLDLHRVGRTEPVWSLSVPQFIRPAEFVADGKLIRLEEALVPRARDADVGQANAWPGGAYSSFRILASADGTELWRPPEAAVQVSGPWGEPHSRELTYWVQSAVSHQVLLDLSNGEPVATNLTDGAGTPYFSHDGSAAIQVYERTGVIRWEAALPRTPNTDP